MVQHTCSVSCDAAEGVRWPTVTGQTVHFSSTGPCTGTLCFILRLLKSHVFSKVRLTHLRSISWLPWSGVGLLLSTPKPLSYSDKHLAGDGGSMYERGFGVRGSSGIFRSVAQWTGFFVVPFWMASQVLIYPFAEGVSFGVPVSPGVSCYS